MFISVIVGLLLGYVLAMPPGPVGVSAMNITLNKGKRSLAYYAAGSGVVDIFFGILAAMAASAVFDMFLCFGDRHPIFMLVMRFLIIILFIIYGIFCLVKSNNNNNDSYKKNNFIGKLSSFFENKPFLLGAFVSGTNITNPTFIPALTYIFLQIKSLGLISDNLFDNFTFAIAFGTGNFLWLFTLSTIIHRNKHLLSELWIYRIKKIGGLLYIFFAGFLAYKVTIMTNWTYLFRLVKA